MRVISHVSIARVTLHCSEYDFELTAPSSRVCRTRLLEQAQRLIGNAKMEASLHLARYEEVRQALEASLNVLEEPKPQATISNIPL